MLSVLGLKLVGPVICRFGTPEQKARFLPRILSGEDQWCQGYSEPGSGSDLASLKTRAVREGDGYCVDGSKIWTTHAQFADWMFALVRTDPDVRAQDGISFLLIPMDQPGVSVTPIITLAGDPRRGRAGRSPSSCSRTSAAARVMRRACWSRSTG